MRIVNALLLLQQSLQISQRGYGFLLSTRTAAGFPVSCREPSTQPRVMLPASTTDDRRSRHSLNAATTTTTMATTTPVLNYLVIPGRGEATRVALAVAGVDYEDKRMNFDEFAACEFKTVPVYQMDGTDYTQSLALLIYAGKLGGLYPDDPLTALKVDEIVMIAEDVFISLFSTAAEKSEAKKIEKSKALMAGKLKILLGDIERKTAANKSSPFCVGDSLTIADLQLHAVVATVEMGFLAGIPPHMVEDMAPSLKAIDNAVMEHPKVKAYYDSIKA